MARRTWHRISTAVALSASATLAYGQGVEVPVVRSPSQLYLKSFPLAVPSVSSSSSAPNAPANVDSLDRLTGSAGTAPPPQNDAQFNALAERFLGQNSNNLGLSNNAATLVLKGVRSIPTGKVVEYGQQLNGLPVIGSHMSVSISPTGDVSSVSKTIFDIPMAKSDSIPKDARINASQALQIVNADLKPAGKVIEPPSVERAYLNENNVLTLVYVVKVAVQQPFGYWEYRVDAQTGRIAEKFDRGINEEKRDLELQSFGAILPAIDLDQVFQFGAPKTLTTPLAGNKVSAKAFVFDPNPVTSLSDSSLSDDAIASRFDKAYIQVQLNDLTQSGAQIHLTGPTVRIEDFEPGEGGRSQAPSSVTTEWTAYRGDNAFNDVMTYYFISQSIEYLRKLGYAGTTELFRAGIAADSDGYGGEDNSHYVPGSDVLAFGHGCVDDNEDTDVILHELGHAISYHINPVWGGGDSGAIGEGFGDYWAVSYRAKLSNGMAPDPGKVFPWDGISACWAARRVDRTGAVYDPARTYRAHQPVGAFVSDELWSTPLVEALNELKEKGLSIDSVDQIVLAGMTDIGAAFTMRQLAANTVAKAKVLFPGTEHAAVFEKWFKVHNILP